MCQEDYLEDPNLWGLCQSSIWKRCLHGWWWYPSWCCWKVWTIWNINLVLLLYTYSHSIRFKYLKPLQKNKIITLLRLYNLFTPLQFFYSMALKPINIRCIIIGSQPYWKIIFFIGANKTCLTLIIIYFSYLRKAVYYTMR